jgi:hypothetical protein
MMALKVKEEDLKRKEGSKPSKRSSATQKSAMYLMVDLLEQILGELKKDKT